MSEQIAAAPAAGLRKIALLACVGLGCLIDGGPTQAKDVSTAVENYRAQANAAALDNRCKVLKPDERAVLDEYRASLVKFIAANDAGFAPSARPSIDAASGAAARSAPCDQAAPRVRGIYEDTVAIKLSMQPALLTIAMNLGERCGVIAKADDGTLMRAWTQLGNDVVKQYNAAIRVKYVLRVHAAEALAAPIPCSDARQTIGAALTLARQVLRD